MVGDIQGGYEKMKYTLSVAAALTAAQSVLAGAPPDLPLGSNLDECLRASSATVLTSGDQAYDSARETYNSRTTFSPQYVVQPNSVEDVQHSVRVGLFMNLKLIYANLRN